MSIETRRLSANGLTFAADVAGRGDTVALLLHGFPECRASWRAQMAALSQLGWTAVAPDLRGYGDSSRPRGRDAYRIEHLVGDVAGLFDALGAKRRILIGHDWGGVIAWQAALRGLPLDGLVVLNAPHPAVFARELRRWDQRRRSWYVLFFQLPVLPELVLTRGRGQGLVSLLRAQSPNFSGALLELYRRNILAPGAATAMLNYYRANARRLAGAPQGDEPISTPTLMIWGENDVALSPALTRGNEAFVAHFTLRRLAGVSHWVQQDAPSEIDTAIAEWAQEQGLGDSSGALR